MDPNVARARDAFETFRSGDLESYKGYFAHDIVWHVSGNHPLSGSYRGKEALFDYFAKVGDLTGGTLQVAPEAILADDGHVGVFARVTAERDGKRLDVVMAQAFTVNGDGRWSEYWAMSDDQAAVDAFWS